MKTKRTIILALTLFICTFVHAQSYTQKSTMSVMGKKTEADVAFSVSMNEDYTKALELSVNGFSYKDKTVGAFTLPLYSQDGGKTYGTKNITVQAKSKEKTTDITITECTLTFKDGAASPLLYMKYKPGKMPFAIVLLPM